MYNYNQNFLQIARPDYQFLSLQIIIRELLFWTDFLQIVILDFFCKMLFLLILVLQNFQIIVPVRSNHCSQGGQNGQSSQMVGLDRLIRVVRWSVWWGWSLVRVVNLDDNHIHSLQSCIHCIHSFIVNIIQFCPTNY